MQAAKLGSGKMKSGPRHCLPPGPRSSLWEAKDKAETCEKVNSDLSVYSTLVTTGKREDYLSAEFMESISQTHHNYAIKLASATGQ